MFNVQSISLRKELVIAFLVMLGLATAAPLLGNQYLTGSLVNAVLFISAVTLGWKNAVAIGLISSTIALATGLLPIVMAPMVPFIMAANALLVTSFSVLRSKSFWLGAGVGAVLKFAFLWATSRLILNLFIEQNVADKIAGMMGLTQLFTALMGAVIAYGALRLGKKI
ncbi:iron hydrogenase [Dehalococcoides mccartyi]|uniref:iron hydrogenase n=1 Tax=Dehalococcoides mccartyi TaxID=61435 RepID=UPI00098EC80A|nr:iron hydrogenase [Dehalococcoides mccartyi]AQU05280.1 iron hydrogenase [Dehalococcoides mccartyi]AQU06733.1 iron hydrogenase [Dehalococcoides mccartyi]